MRRRLMLAYLCLTALLLIALGSPLALSYALNEYHHFAVMLLGMTGALALIAAGLLVIPLTRWMTRPIRQLAYRARAIAGGDYNVRAPAGAGPPEVRHLAEAFDTMADRLVTLVHTQRHFVADASHQMRNPLTALRLRVESLVVVESSETARRAAIGEIERLSAILDQLLVLSRTGIQQRPAEPVDVAVVVKGRCEAWGEVAARKGVRLSRQGESVVAACVSGSLEQILDVLIDNALHAAPAGGAVTVSYGMAGEGGVTISVVDDGPGMPAEELARARERFWRGSGSAGRSGTGLGLAIADVLVKANHGVLALETISPHGLRAMICLPVDVKAE
jgi:signal transduction histidine kinase